MNLIILIIIVIVINVILVTMMKVLARLAEATGYALVAPLRHLTSDDELVCGDLFSHFFVSKLIYIFQFVVVCVYVNSL